MRTKVVGGIRTLVGLGLSLAAAFASAALFSHSKVRLFVPLGFAVILVFLAARFGVLVSVLGSLIATIVFAHRLYAPLGTLQVQDGAARASLAWMILASTALSYLLFPPQTRSRH